MSSRSHLNTTARDYSHLRRPFCCPMFCHGRSNMMAKIYSHLRRCSPAASSSPNKHGGGVFPTPAALLVADTFPRAHEHGGGAFRRHLPPPLFPLAGTFHGHTNSVVVGKVLAGVDGRESMFVPYTFTCPHKCSSGVFHPHPLSRTFSSTDTRLVRGSGRH